jgi:hypothetical protein
MRRLAWVCALSIVAGAAAAPAGSAAREGSFTYDVRLAKGSRPAVGEVRLLIGGTPHGSYETRDGKRVFEIERVTGAKLIWKKRTTARGRLVFGLGGVCRAYPAKRYFLRVSFGGGEHAFVHGRCAAVLRMLASGKRATVVARFVFRR